MIYTMPCQTERVHKSFPLTDQRQDRKLDKKRRISAVQLSIWEVNRMFKKIMVKILHVCEAYGEAKCEMVVGKDWEKKLGR